MDGRAEVDARPGPGEGGVRDPEAVPRGGGDLGLSALPGRSSLPAVPPLAGEPPPAPSPDVLATSTTPAASPVPAAPAAREPEQVASLVLEAIRETTDAQTAALQEALAALGTQLAELNRLRSHDRDIIDRLHAENTRLRVGEYASAVTPLILQLLRLHDQMLSLDDRGDPRSIAGMLRVQLLQVLDTAAGVVPFEPAAGEPFESRFHAGVGRRVTTDPSADQTIARTLRPGFCRADGSVVRAAEVEVNRHHVS